MHGDLTDRETLEQQNEQELRLAIQQAYLDVAKGSLDRALKRAEYIMTAASTIATAYTALLGLIYFTGKPAATGILTGNPLTLKAIVPVILLGLAICLSAFYVVPIFRENDGKYYLADTTEPNLQEKRMVTFLAWVSSGVKNRSWALTVATMFLGLGVITLPIFII